MNLDNKNWKYIMESWFIWFKDKRSKLGGKTHDNNHKLKVHQLSFKEKKRVIFGPKPIIKETVIHGTHNEIAYIQGFTFLSKILGL